MSGTWDYVDNGPDTWAKSFPLAAGQKQSPIDIRISECSFDESLQNSKFQFNYNPKDCTIVINTGSQWRVGVTKDATSSLRVSFSNDEYQLQQIHAHWSTDSHNGSEHLLNGLGYAAEVHIVHFNKKYGSFEEAVNHPDGLLVLGSFLDEGLHNEAFDGLLAVMDKISYKNETTEIQTGFNVAPLIPPIHDFWTYEGSLTTPPCAECVTWVVFRGTISISRQQLEKMRGLHTVGVEDAERNPLRMACIVRPPQPLNGRTVRSSFLSPKQQ